MMDLETQPTQTILPTDLGLPDDVQTQIMIESGIEWLNENTTIDTEEALPSVAKLFLIKFVEMQSVGGGVVSESIEGMSQSYGTSNKNDMLWEYAESLLGGFLKSRIKFVTAEKRWN